MMLLVPSVVTSLPVNTTLYTCAATVASLAAVDDDDLMKMTVIM